MTALNRTLLSWVDSSAYRTAAETAPGHLEAIDWARIVPFMALHVACVAVVFVGWSPTAVMVAAGSYVIRMFAITGFYHRYFAHRSFKTSRATQFVFALLGAAATQRGPIWWAAHHRHHHVTADTEQDCHSPRRGFWWSHVGWFLTRGSFMTREGRVRDLMRYPELRWLDRFDTVVPVALCIILYIAGEWLAAIRPRWGTDGLQLVVWGYFISTVVLLHVTLSINSLAHRFGSVRFATDDDSRNSFLLALLTLGEGWHNNHHFYPVSARQGLYWWEIDVTYYTLKLMSMLGLVWDMKTVPPKRLHQGLAEAGVRP